MLKRMFKNIYIASFVASFISCITLTQIYGAKHVLQIGGLVTSGTISNLSIQLLTTIATILIAVAIIIYARKKALVPEQLIKSIIKMYMIFTAVMVVAVYDGSILTSQNNFFIGLRVLASLIYESIIFILPIIVWGVINTIYSKDKKKITYVVLSLVISLITILTPYALTSFFASALYARELTSVITSLIGLGILLAYVAKWIHLAPKSSEADQKHIKANKFPWLKSSLLLIVVTTGGVFTLFNSVFLYYVYSKHPEVLGSSFSDTNYLAIILTSSTIIAIMLFAFADYSFRKRTWRFALQGSIIALLVGCALAFGMICLMPNSYLFTTVTVHNFFGSVRAILIFPLIQLLYLYLPVNDRFNMKLKIEMICVPAAILIISNTVTGIAATSGIKNALTYISLSLGLILILAALWASKSIAKELKD